MQTAGIKTDYDVVIVGAGLVGAAMALALRDSGLRLALVDMAPLQTTMSESASDALSPDFDARVSAITPASRLFFESLDVWDLMQKQRVSPYTHMHVREADGTGAIDFCAADVHADALGYIVENRVSVAAMHQSLQQQPMLTTLMPASVQSIHSQQDHIEIRLTKPSQTITARLLVAADGAQSPVRAMAGFATREWDYEHEAIVCSVRTELPHGQCARQIFMDDGVLAFLPLLSDGHDAGHWCSIVWSALPSRAQALMGLPEAAFNDTLGYASEHWLGKITGSSPRFSFSLRQRHALDYFRDRVVLVGDAAHSIHPLAGQGANLGLADVSALARELRRAQSAGRDFADPVVLSRYQRQRKPHNLAMMLMMEGFKRLYADQPLPLRWLRNAGMKTVDHWPLLKHQLIREAMGQSH